MKKMRLLAVALAAAMMLGACSSGTEEASTENAEETTQTEEAAEGEEAKEAEPAEEDVTVRVGSLNGPTTMGLVRLMQLQDEGETKEDYEFTMVSQADELSANIVSGDLDIALLPANVASVLYGKTDSGVSVIDINTLGVLYMVTSNDDVSSFEDLKDKTVYITGKGTTPDYVFRYLMKENGLTEDDVTLEFKSESTEVAAVLAEEENAIGVLPQPFVTAACSQNEDLKVVMDLTEEWDKVQSEGSGSRLVTGATIVRNEFLEEHPDVVAQFLEDHKASTEYTETNLSEAAELVAEAGIVEQAAVAEKAMPKCNIVCITGEEMKEAMEGYLTALYEQDPESVGGALPEDSFYYME